MANCHFRIGQTCGGGWSGRGWDSGHERDGWQARRGDTARGAAGSGNSGGRGPRLGRLGGADGRKGLRTRSNLNSVRYAETGEESWDARGRASGNGRGGWQARRRGAARDAAGSGNSGGGTVDHGRGADNDTTRDAGDNKLLG
jgi:hypothetical protein